MKYHLRKQGNRFRFYIDEEGIDPRDPDIPARGFKTKEAALEWIKRNKPTCDVVEEC